VSDLARPPLPPLRSVGPDDAPTAVIAHGSASTADFALRVFGPAVVAAGFRAVSWDRRTPANHIAEELATIAERTAARLVGGISVGALAAARVVTERPAQFLGLLVALPPWLGVSDATARLTSLAADELERLGVEGARGGLTGAPPWVAREVTAAWQAWGDAALLVGELRATAAYAGPSAEQLAGCGSPSGIVTLAGDPLHPLDAAGAWAGVLPAAELRVLDLHAPQDDVAVIGAGAVEAWQSARQTLLI
jgi:hypothetical protein